MQSIEQKIKGDKLIFTHSNSINRNRVGTRTTAYEVITCDDMTKEAFPGKSLEDKGDRLIAHSTTVDFYKQIGGTKVEIMKQHWIFYYKNN